jgi:hypothetical protein
MIWAQLLAYVTGTVDQELRLRNEYLATENRILKAQIKGRLLLSEEEKATLAVIERDVFHTTQSVSVRALAIQEFDQNAF